jgi:hypothetical protein
MRIVRTSPFGYSRKLRQEFIRHSSPIARVVALINVAGLITPPSLEEVAFMRRTLLLLSTMVLALLLASGVALAVNKVGTSGPDTLRGTNGDDNLAGLGGNDKLFSLGGDDNLVGGSGKDVVMAGRNDPEHPGTARGDKNLMGGPGNDIVFGGPSFNNVVGAGGNDLLVDGPHRESAEDNLSGGAGNDVLLSDNRPVFKDIVTCGAGFDRVLADSKDVVTPDCERVFIGLPIEKFLGKVPPSFFEGLPPYFF